MGNKGIRLKGNTGVVVVTNLDDIISQNISYPYEVVARCRLHNYDTTDTFYTLSNGCSNGTTGLAVSWDNSEFRVNYTDYHNGTSVFSGEVMTPYTIHDWFWLKYEVFRDTDNVIKTYGYYSNNNSETEPVAWDIDLVKRTLPFVGYENISMVSAAINGKGIFEVDEIIVRQL